MARAVLVAPPSVPRSFITPLVQRKAWLTPAALSALPATCPAALIPPAVLFGPPSVPRSSKGPVPRQRNAWKAPLAVWAPPATQPAKLTAVALLFAPPRVPRSRRPLERYRTACVVP